MLMSQSNCTTRLRALSHASIVSWPTITLLSDDGMDCSDAEEPNHNVSFGNVQLQSVRSAPIGNVS